ncbi:MAG: SGNH/GDSL hydrolase family protein [Chloroflexota bacterium]|nr:SGNH/GDSL hydrolase family protein [Chloroflexota bacterium]
MSELPMARDAGGARLGRRVLVLAGGVALALAATASALSRQQSTKRTTPGVVYTFGDSILDCGHYNPYGVTPGGLLVQNDDRLFPEFHGRDLSSRGPARLEHRARDGATVATLAAQARGLAPESGEAAVALVTIGGNDLLQGLIADRGGGMDAFRAALDAFLRDLPVRPVLLGNVYDPTFGDDSRNFLAVDPALARANQRRMMAVHAQLGARYGQLVDLHAHFLRGDPSWFVHTIEPSLRGASEVRHAFLEALALG